MKRNILVMLFALAVGASAFASTVTVAVDHHLAAYGPLEKVTTLRTTFTEERVLADVHLEIYAVPQLPSSREHLAELSALPKDAWWKQLDWHLVDMKTGKEVSAPDWRLVSSDAEERGPHAGDATKAVDMRILSARFELGGSLPAGDYGVSVTIGGARSRPFLFAVRTGREPEVRDVYLATQAARTTDYVTYRALQLERAKNNPESAAPYLELAERSLEQGSLAETQQYFDAAMAATERLMQRHERTFPAWVQQQRSEWAPRAERIRALRSALPEYFAHRDEWRVTSDPATGNYVIRSRRDGRLVRDLSVRR